MSDKTGLTRTDKLARLIRNNVLGIKKDTMTQPNILFLFSDEHSHRFMGHVSPEDGGESVWTPTFDRLASRGTVFTDAYC